MDDQFISLKLSFYLLRIILIHTDKITVDRFFPVIIATQIEQF